MRVSRLLLFLLFGVAIAVAGCARGPMIAVPMAAAPAPYGIDNVVYGGASAYAPARPAAYAPAPAPAYAAVATPNYAVAPSSAYATPRYATPAYATPAYATPAYAAPAYATRAYIAPAYAAPAYAAPAYAAGYPGAAAYAPTQHSYTLDSGDRLRVVVFGQDGLTNSYVLDASGDIDMPLIGTVAARGLTTDQLTARITGLLRQGYVRDPHVAVEIEAYRPFFILGEVAQPGQYPYVANMTVETAVAIAGGFGPRGYKKAVTISRNYGGQTVRFQTPITAPVQPGDTIQVQERWF
ncbi:MAG: polysaccharide biosynthesis/export family protein [Xanthobacteraceae bacterium]